MRLKSATVIHVSKDGFVLGVNGRGVYVHSAGFLLPLGAVVDVVVHKVGSFGGARQIEALHVENIYAKKADAKEHMLELAQFEKARAGDVIRVVEGEIKDGYIVTNVGKIKLYSKGKKPKDGRARFASGRVGMYGGKKELIIEE